MGPRSFNRGNRSPPCTMPTWPPRFNGAAVFQPRKSDAHADAMKAQQEASMGPRSFNRGNDGERLPGACAAGASMGPRSFNRGNNPSRPIGVRVQRKLQWGRGLSTAEIAQTGGRSSTISAGFNGAAVFQPRK